MAKQKKQTAKATTGKPTALPVPQFPERTVIDRPALVTDVDGRPWWVDPGARTITRAG
jgi:hypothetical protein